MKRILFLFPLLFCLSSCWDYVEPSSENYVLGLGIDYVDDKYLVSIETVKITGEPSSLSSSEGITIQGEGYTFYAAVKDATAKAGKSLYWGHMEIVFLSEEIAKNHLYTISDAISRTPDIYSNVDLAITKGCLTADILTAKMPQDTMVSVHIANIFENGASSRNCSLWQLKKTSDFSLIPAIHLENGPVVSGCAVLVGNVLLGYLNDAEVRLFSIVEEEKSGALLPNITIEGVSLSTEIVNVQSAQGKIHITFALLNSSEPFDTINPENRRKIEAKISSLISEQIDSLIAKPFGNILSYDSYEVEATLKSSGLIKR